MVEERSCLEIIRGRTLIYRHSTSQHTTLWIVHSNWHTGKWYSKRNGDRRGFSCSRLATQAHVQTIDTELTERDNYQQV
jgi:hypothetical protein